MKVGDKVRLLRGTEEGHIVHIKNNKIVEIEIEDGFVIPALINEVVVVDSSEAENFRQEQEKTEQSVKEEKPNIPDGIYVGLKEINPDQFDAFLINQTENQLLFSIGQYNKKVFNGKSSGICEKFEIKEIGDFTSSIFNASKRIHVQIIIHEKEARITQNPINKDVFIEKHHLKKKEYVNSVSEELALINLLENVTNPIDTTELRSRMLSGSRTPVESQTEPQLLHENEIDLHFDSKSSSYSPGEILKLQLNEFEKAYDNALVMNVQKLKVIHGIGSGILRNEIHKRLSKKSEVKFFEDADKERFGFGSTIIYF